MSCTINFYHNVQTNHGHFRVSCTVAIERVFQYGLKVGLELPALFELKKKKWVLSYETIPLWFYWCMLGG